MIVDLEGLMVSNIMTCSLCMPAQVSKHQQHSHVLSPSQGGGNRVPLSTTRVRHLLPGCATAGNRGRTEILGGMRRA